MEVWLAYRPHNIDKERCSWTISSYCYFSICIFLFPFALPIPCSHDFSFLPTFPLSYLPLCFSLTRSLVHSFLSPNSSYILALNHSFKSCPSPKFFLSYKFSLSIFFLISTILSPAIFFLSSLFLYLHHLAPYSPSSHSPTLYSSPSFSFSLSSHTSQFSRVSL